MPPLNNAQTPIIPTRSPFRIRDSQLSKIQETDNRFSLAIEVDNIWNIKPIENSAQHQQQEDGGFSSKNLLTQLLISQAILDSNEFKVIPFESLEQLKKELLDIQDKINHITKNIELENRIIKISKSLENKNFKNSRHSVLYLQNQRQNNESKMKSMVSKLGDLKDKEIEIKKLILEHNSAVLNKGIQNLETSSTPTLEKDQYNQIIKKINHLVPNIAHLNPQQKLKELERHVMNRNNSTRVVENSVDINELYALKLDKNKLLLRLYEIESLLDKLLSTVNYHPKRKAALKIELSQYKSELIALKIWIKSNTSHSNYDDIHSKFKKQLLDQSSYFEKNIKEQNTLIQKNKRNFDSLKTDYDKVLEAKTSLDFTIKEKSRHLDEQNNKISMLNHEIRLQNSQPIKSKTLNPIIEEKYKKLFNTREENWTEHMTMTEDGFDELMDNFDKLTIQAMEFESHRMKYDKKIDALTNSIQELEMQLINEKINKIGSNDSTTVSLRKEFRVLVADIKKSHQQRLDQEQQEIQRLKSQLEELQNDNSRYKYAHTISTQTD